MPGNRSRSQRAIDRGNTIHDAIENYLGNVEDALEVDNLEFRGLLKIMKPFLDKINNIHALEVPLYSHTLEMAGRVDCVAEYEGVLSIIDFKGSDKIKKEEWIESYFLQATVYSIMWEERTSMPITQLVTIIAVDHEEPQVFVEHRDNWDKKLIETINLYKARQNL